MQIAIKQLPHAEGLPLPAYQTAGAAGIDLVAALTTDAEIILNPGDRTLIPTGLIMEIERGFEGQIRPRSGLAFKHGITVLNSPGTIDSRVPFPINRGDRIAQMVFAAVQQANLVVVDVLSETSRAGGFGSTGRTTI